jgi:hypothetical protein
VGAIDGETQFLPILIHEQQQHEYIRQNDCDYRTHSDIPHLAAPRRATPRPGAGVAGSNILDPSLDLCLQPPTSRRKASAAQLRLTEAGPIDACL